MIRPALMLIIVASFGCSMARPSVTIRNGSADAFSNVQRVCIYGSDANTDVDVEGLIAHELARLLPEVNARRPCGDGEAQIIIQYQSGLSACTHCPPEWRNPRFGIAIIQATSGDEIRGEAEWNWLKGGSAKRLARRFAESLARFLAAPDTAPLQRND